MNLKMWLESKTPRNRNTNIVSSNLLKFSSVFHILFVLWIDGGIAAPVSTSRNLKAFFPRVGGSSVHFDDDDEWSFGANEENNFLQVAVHEYGHVLGLSHSAVEGSVMYPWYNSNFTLHEDDIQAIQSLYGKPSPPSTETTKNESTTLLGLLSVLWGIVISIVK